MTRTSKQHRYCRAISNAALVEALQNAELPQDDVDFVAKCAEAVEENGWLEQPDRDRLVRLAKPLGIVGSKAKSTAHKSNLRPYEAAIASGSAAYDQLIVSARDALTCKPPLRQVDR